MPRPLIFIHGYSSEGTAFDPLRDALVKEAQAKGAPLDIQSLDICTYVSLNNEITIKDIAEGFDRALSRHQVLGNSGQEFDAIVHSTGMLVLRSWLTNYGAAVGSNDRLKRLKHLVGVAPATWGSPQAHKGRTWLGALVKGNRQLGPDFLNAGDRVLDGLELGSEFTWELAHADLLSNPPYYDKGASTPYICVFIGNHGYTGIESVANDPGTDGTVRWAGCSLNTRKITIDLTKTPFGPDGKPAQRVSISPWANSRLDIPMIPVNDRDHSSLIANPDPDMVSLILDFIKVGEPGAPTIDAWLAAANQFGKKGIDKMMTNPGAEGVVGEVKDFFGHLVGAHLDSTLEGWQQFVVRAVDEHGDGITDYLIEVLTQENGVWREFKEMFTDVHAYQTDTSFRCFHIRLPKGISSQTMPLKVRISASTGTDLVTYQGYSGGEKGKQLNATAGPVELVINQDLGQGNGSLFYPFTTTSIEIVLNREPLPLDDVSRILYFLGTSSPK